MVQGKRGQVHIHPFESPIVREETAADFGFDGCCAALKKRCQGHFPPMIAA